jgi:hypothetical protein
LRFLSFDCDDGLFRASLGTDLIRPIGVHL